MPGVDRDVVLVAESGNGDIDRRHRAVRLRLGLGELDRPARVTIFLASFRRLVLPIPRDAAGLDVVLFLLRIPLLRRGDKAGIHDLPGHGDIAGLAQHRIEALEQGFDRSGLGQSFPIKPDRARIGNPVRKPQPKEPHERQPVIDQELGAFVRQIVDSVDDQHLQHHDGIVGRAATVRPSRIGKRLFQIGPERLEVHNPAIGFELIAKVAQPPKPVVDVKETRRHGIDLQFRIAPSNHKTTDLARLLEPSSCLQGPRRAHHSDNIRAVARTLGAAASGRRIDPASAASGTQTNQRAATAMANETARNRLGDYRQEGEFRPSSGSNRDVPCMDGLRFARPKAAMRFRPQTGA